MTAEYEFCVLFPKEFSKSEPTCGSLSTSFLATTEAMLSSSSMAFAPGGEFQDCSFPLPNIRKNKSPAR